jgi:hypothetical protein
VHETHPSLQVTDGTLPRPDGPADAENNDKTVIMNDSTAPGPQMTLVGQCYTASAMSSSLEAVHESESKGPQTTIVIMRKLFHTFADDNTDISEHLNVLKQYWEQINLVADEDSRISETLFKVIISSSLPLSWDAWKTG